ncbi:hypothetical protein E0L36_02365 [Streptomyces sp. AJS327]|uniref:hypothetical protein n=1 Tax=Streptomyces sp. AJS327 TaxID=2545265 RepID=UPI0015DFE5E8|nr:hypothetical protein [Streptomyces sp. AJS327]MBA0049787.1 hypothetical protein [Streptomyces sp. AJS327]
MGVDARARVAACADPSDSVTGITLLLAEIHPDTFTEPSPSPPAPLLDPLPTHRQVWSDFLHRALRLLPPDGILLIATRQHRSPQGLFDPLGDLTAAARSAGFLYLQHVVVVHARAAEDRLQPPAATEALPNGLSHSDLLLFSPLT